MTKSATISGRPLANPSPGTEPHLEFIDQVVEGLIDAKAAGDGAEDRVYKMLNCAKMFKLGQPGINGEPLRSGPQVEQSS